MTAGGSTARTGERRTAGTRVVAPTAIPSRVSGGWPAAGRGGQPGADRTGDRPGADDPLTSTAYSRASASDSDGRSYRVAARRSQAQAKLTEQTQVFSAPTGYPSDQQRTGPYESGLTGEYPARQYDTGARGRTRRRARRAVPDRRHRRVPDQPAPRDRCVRGERQVRGRPVPDRRVPDRRLPDRPVPDRLSTRPANTASTGPTRSPRPPATRATPAASRARPGSSAPPSARASRASRVGAGSRPRSAPADRTLRAGRTDSAGTRSATRAGPACRTRSARPPASTRRSSPGTGSRARSLSYRSPSYPQSQAPQSQPPRQPAQPQPPGVTGGQGANGQGTGGQGAGSPAGGAAGQVPARPAPGATPTSRR